MIVISMRLATTLLEVLNVIVMLASLEMELTVLVCLLLKKTANAIVQSTVIVSNRWHHPLLVMILSRGAKTSNIMHLNRTLYDMLSLKTVHVATNELCRQLLMYSLYNYRC